MTYTSADARQELLDGFAWAIERIGLALAALGAAYEQLDEYNADRSEAELFGPVQLAYGRAKSTHAGFADRHGITSRAFATPSPGIPSIGAKGFIDSAVNAVAEADSALSALQDSSWPTEVGDVELRAGLTDVRELLDGASPRTSALPASGSLSARMSIFSFEGSERALRCWARALDLRRRRTRGRDDAALPVQVQLYARDLGETNR